MDDPVATADGQVWGIPSNSLSVLRISPSPSGDVVSTIPGPSGKPLVGGQHRDDDKYKYLGGVVSPIDGCMYCIPLMSKVVLKISPGASLPESGTEADHGRVRDSEKHTD